MHKPKVLGLLEPRTSGVQVDEICRKIGFDNWVCVEAVGFSEGIWIFWMYVYSVDIMFMHPQLWF